MSAPTTNSKKALKELEKQLRKQPGSLVIRIRLAAALHSVGRLPEAVDLYRSVAMAYFAQGRLDQAMAVCHSLLEIAPMHQDTHLLLAELDSHKAKRPPRPPTEAPDGSGAPWVSATGAQDANGRKVSKVSNDSGASQAIPRRDGGIRRDSGLLRRDTSTGSWRTDSSRGPRRDTLDPSGVGSGAGSSGVGNRDGSVASRLPLPVVRTVTGIGPAPVRSRRSSESAPPTALGRPRRLGDPLVALPRSGSPEPRVPPPPSSVDEDAPTHIADRWLSPLSTESGRVPSPAQRYDFRPGPRRASSGGESDMYTSPRGPIGSERVPPYRPLPRRAPSMGEGAEPTQYDDQHELARAFGRAYSEEDVAADAGALPVLSGLPERAVQAIAAGMVRRRIPAGEIVVRDGEPGESCFVLARGEARILKRDPLLPRGDLLEVSRLNEGDLFGEVAMLGDRRRHASVQAVSDCELLEIPRAHLVQVGRRFPEVDSFMQQFYRERLIATLVSTASFFRPLDLPQRTNLLSHFQFSHVEAGTRIIGEGERAGGFFLIVLGSVEITKRVSDRRQVLLATLGEGTYFGEMSLLRGEVARASVTATSVAELAVLPAKNFYALVANHPVLWDQVRQEAHQRELEMVQIVTGVSGTV